MILPWADLPKTVTESPAVIKLFVATTELIETSATVKSRDREPCALPIVTATPTATPHEDAILQRRAESDIHADDAQLVAANLEDEEDLPVSEASSVTDQAAVAGELEAVASEGTGKSNENRRVSERT